MYWTFKVFINTHGDNEFEEWRAKLVAKDRAKIPIFINRLRLIKTWDTKLVKPLKGHTTISELRIKGLNNVQLRPLGCLGPREGEFTILVGAIERDGVFNPKNAPQRAEDRRKLVFQDKRYIKDYE